MARLIRRSRWNNNNDKAKLFVCVAIALSVLGIMNGLQSVIEEDPLPNRNLSEGAPVRNGSAATKLKRQHPQFDPSWDVMQRIEAEQTGRVLSPRTPPPLPPVNFLDPTQLAKEDAYSASWLQTTQHFLSMDMESIQSARDAAVLAYTPEQRWPTLRMTMDWLDFSLEHVSSWCDMMDVLKRDIPFWRLSRHLKEYLARPYPLTDAFSDGIAVVAFQPFKGTDNKHQFQKAHELSVLLLAASIESIRRAGFGRTVVVGLQDSKLAHKAFQLVNDNNTPTMEMGYVQGNSSAGNVPKAALLGLRDAFQGGVNKMEWLGDSKQQWNYVYLTEGDNLLQTRPKSLLVLKQLVDTGKVLIPHRFQPIPHQRDIAGTGPKHTFLSNRDFASNAILELNGLATNPGYCCDEHKGPDWKPGLTTNNGEECANGKPWFLCDFDPAVTEPTHERLRHYSLIKLTQGTGLTLLSAGASGRGCVPPKKKVKNSGVCSEGGFKN